MDPLRYIDLQLEICRQLARNTGNLRFPTSNPQFQKSQEQIRRQDRETFETAAKRVSNGLENERRYLEPGNEPRRRAIEERARQLEEYRRAVYGG